MTNNNWDESKHPRTSDGKFTYKGLGETSTESDEEKIQRRADNLYGSDEEYYKKYPKKNSNKTDGILTGGAASVGNSEKNRFALGAGIDDIYIPEINTDNLVANAKIYNDYNSIQDLVKSDQDKKFFTILNKVFDFEGGYSNRKSDLGGETNFGVTQNTYNEYCKNHNLPYKSVKNLTKAETIQVYYNDFWKKSYADKTNDFFTSLFLFDTAVNHGSSTARRFYKNSNGDIEKMIEMRKQYYKDIIDNDNKKGKNKTNQQKNENGWNNRMKKLEKIYSRLKEMDKIQKTIL